MNVIVELVYDDSKRNRNIVVTVSDRLTGNRLMNAIDKAVTKAAKDDKDWTRWNLKDMVKP